MPDFHRVNASDNPHHAQIEKKREAKRDEQRKAIEAYDAEKARENNDSSNRASPPGS